MSFNLPEYRNLVDGFYQIMIAHSELALVRVPDDNWTLADMIGHLIDSYTNNYQRIIRLQLIDHLSFPGYDAEEWASVSKAGTLDYRFLADFWKSCNVHLLGIIERIDETKLGNVWESASGPMTLACIVKDYYTHLEWHINYFEQHVAKIRNCQCGSIDLNLTRP